MSQPGGENSGGSEHDRLPGSQETPQTPSAAPPPFTQINPETDNDPTAEQRRLHEADTLQQERMATLIGHLRAFRQGPEHADWDGDAYEALTRIPGLALGPLAEMIGHGAEIRTRLDHFKESQSDLQDRLDAATFECRRLEAAALVEARVAAVTRARTYDPPASGGFALHSNFGAPGSGGPNSATSATSASSATSAPMVTSVQIQGRTMHLADPLTSHMARAFRGWAMGEQREGRVVHLPALIALATQRTITGRFRLHSEQRAFCPEFPLGATSEADKAHVKVLAADPATWWLSWPLQTFLDALIRAFPSEREGASASIKTLEELMGDILLPVNASDFAPLSKYRGAVYTACELAAPREAGNETNCVRALHAGFSGRDVSAASREFKTQLDITFGRRGHLHVGGGQRVPPHGDR
jgi:hypothetical protein